MDLLAGGFALVATMMAAFVGGGASMFLFPLLIAFIPGTYISLFITGKVGAMVMALTASKMHIKRNALETKLILNLLISGFLGTGLGTYFLQYHFDEILFKRILFAAVVVAAVYLFWDKKIGVEEKSDHEIKPTFSKHVAVFLFSFFINILNGIFGGTGIFITVFLVVFLKKSFLKTSGYTMTLYAIISVFQVIYLATTETFDPTLALFVLLGSLVGGYLGTRLQYLKGSVWIKRASILMLIAVAVKMIL